MVQKMTISVSVYKLALNRNPDKTKINWQQFTETKMIPNLSSENLNSKYCTCWNGVNNNKSVS